MALLIGDFHFQSLIELVYRVAFIHTLIADGTAAVGFIFVYHEVAVNIFIDTEGLWFFIVFSDEKAGYFLRGKIMSLVPFL